MHWTNALGRTAYAVTLLLTVGCPAKQDAATGDGGNDDDAGDTQGGDDGGMFTMGGDDGVDDGAEVTGGGDSADAPDDGGDGGDFIMEPDGGVAGQCDPTTQDCPDGEKCTAWGSIEGEPWNANKCVPLTGAGQLGDPCNIEGGKYTGEDDCDLGLICLLTDDEGNDGACIEFCNTTMTCPSGGSCSVYNDGSLPICLTSCDPLIQDCPDGQGCYASSAGNEFICFKYSGENGEGGVGDECNYLNQCQPGTACLSAAAVQGCTAGSCCAPFCDLADPDPEADCNTDEMCTQFFDMPSPEYVDVGVCALPA